MNVFVPVLAFVIHLCKICCILESNSALLVLIVEPVVFLVDVRRVTP